MRLSVLAVACLVFCAPANAVESYALLDEYEGAHILVPAAGGCSTESSPIVFNARLPEQLRGDRIFGNLWQYLNTASILSGRYRCYVEDGDIVYFEGRVSGTPVLRGRTKYDFASIADTTIERIDTAVEVPDTPFNAYLSWLLNFDKEKGSPAPEAISRLETMLENELSSSERVTALYDLATWTESEDLMRQAADMGHPVAMYRRFERLGLVQKVWSAIAAQRDGDSSLLAGLGPDLAEHGDLLFDSAELGFIEAIDLLDSAEDAGVKLAAGGGVTLAELPTPRDIENALNGRLRQSTTTSDALISGASGLPPGQMLTCDDDWCTFLGYGYFRFSRPDSAQCEGGNDAAVCDITFRYISRVGLGTGFWDSPHTELANAMASNMSRAHPISARISLQRTNGQWAIVGPIETY